MRLFRNFRIYKILLEVYDPNQIRKRIRIHFKEKIILANLGNIPGKYFLDLNDHLPYRAYMTNSGDPIIIEVGKIIGLSSRDIFLDVGANIGLICIPVGLYFNCEIIAIEAMKRNAAKLLINSSMNNTKIKLHTVCVGDKETVKSNPWARIYSRSGNSGAASLFRDWNPSLSGKLDDAGEFVRSATIDTLINQEEIRRIGLIKIDIEGSEEAALNGFTNLQYVNAPIIFEYRVDLVEKYLNLKIEGLVTLLREHFVLYSIKIVKNHLILQEFDKLKSQEHAIAIPKLNHDYFRLKFYNHANSSF